ncbi:GPW/gp25 family protein [Bradyrhizobium sp. 2S1]|uniref:GPW/gp25 family protein n=1 Tax=Bradyrhizobium sp. 2S1 TaxID=1404429 RepID=UPI001CD0E05E|nr:GPW/gp25 family protein [Bradyrhizobium sp. 2S1]MCK7665034.1 GPW/gp25 family protein [Bradyrhizobium sp. 2S1]
MENIDQKDFLGVGWAYPVSVDALTGDAAMARYERDVHQAIRIILETSHGERVMRPDFGCGIHDLVFEEINVTTLRAVEASVREALTRFEARIEIDNVTVDPRQALDGVLLITLTYRIRRTNQVDNLVYPFYFCEGGPQ